MARKLTTNSKIFFAHAGFMFDQSLHTSYCQFINKKTPCRNKRQDPTLSFSYCSPIQEENERH